MFMLVCCVSRLASREEWSGAQNATVEWTRVAAREWMQDIPEVGDAKLSFVFLCCLVKILRICFMQGWCVVGSTTEISRGILGIL